MVNTDEYQGKQGFSIWVKGIVDKLLSIWLHCPFQTRNWQMPAYRHEMPLHSRCLLLLLLNCRVQAEV